jgi:hypothetical protein
MLESTIKTFADNLSALREFVLLIGSLLDSRQTNIVRRHRKEFIPLLLLLHKAGVQTELTDDRIRQLESEFGGKLQIEQEEEEKDKEGKKWSLKISGEEWDADLVMKTLRADSAHRSLLYRSALISLVSAAEWFLSQVIRTFFDKYPGASGADAKTLTLEDLKSLGSIEDAQRYLIDMRITEIMWGSFEDWLKFLTGTVKLSASYLDPEKDALIEVFQRRNVMVHNNGLVPSIYMQKVPAELRKGVSLGADLTVSADYLAKSIDLVEKNFILLAAELWKQLNATDEKRGGGTN